MNESIADTEDGMKFIVGATALKRWGELREIRGAAIFLASDASIRPPERCSRWTEADCVLGFSFNPRGLRYRPFGRLRAGHESRRWVRRATIRPMGIRLPA